MSIQLEIASIDGLKFVAFYFAILLVCGAHLMFPEWSFLEHTLNKDK